MKTIITKTLLISSLATLAGLSQNAKAQPGSLDNTFNTNGIVATNVGSGSTDDFAYSVAIQSNDKIVVAGFTGASPARDFALVRYNTDGSLDNTFDTDGKVITDFGADDLCYGVAVQSGDKIIAVGTTGTYPNRDFAIVRYNTDGSLDNSFGTGGKVTTNINADDIARSIKIQSDGKIVVAGQCNGSSYNFAIVRYNSDGTLDNSFGSAGKVNTDLGANYDAAFSLAIQSDGSIVVAGTTGAYHAYNYGIVRYTSTGVLDNTFDTDGKLVTDLGGDDQGYSVAVQSDGKIVMVGWSDFTSPFDDYSVAMVRYNNDGSMDTAFGTAGTQYQKCGGIYDEGANGVVIQPDGKIVIIGSLVSTTGMMSAISCNTDGSLDATFNGGSTGHSNVSFGTNIDSYGKAIALQSDGKIVIAGYRYASGTTNPDFAVARLNGTVTFSRSEFSNNGISIYPNPANHNINIKGIEGKTVIKLYDVLGNLVMDASTSSGLTKENKTTLNTNQLTEGIYTVVTENNSGCTISKVVINK